MSRKNTNKIFREEENDDIPKKNKHKKNTNKIFREEENDDIPKKNKQRKNTNKIFREEENNDIRKKNKHRKNNTIDESNKKSKSKIISRSNRHNESDNESDNNLSDNSDYEKDVDDIDDVDDKFEKITISNKNKQNSPNKVDKYKEEQQNTKFNIDKQYKSNHILEIRTTHTEAIKQVFERLGSVISDCSILFIKPNDEIIADECDDYYEEISDKKNKNKTESNTNKNNAKKNTGGIRIVRLSESKNILIHLRLDYQNFNFFYCEDPIIRVNVDINNLNNKLKLVSNSVPIMIYMNRDNRSVLYIKSCSDEDTCDGESAIEIYLMDEEYIDVRIPKTKFQNVISIDSTKFHSICKQIYNNSQVVEIIIVGNKIKFRGEDDGGKMEISFLDPTLNNNSKEDMEIVQGKFELKNIIGFSKSNKLCGNIKIYMKNSFPLLLGIEVQTLGKMYVFLTPIDEEAH